MSDTQFAVYMLPFLAGVVVGVILCYITVTKIFKGHRMQDELLKSRRDLANAQRSVDEFLKTSSDLFAQLDVSYRRYADFMHNASEKMSTVGNELFISLDELKTEDDVTEKQKMEDSAYKEDLSNPTISINSTPVATANVKEVIEKDTAKNKENLEKKNSEQIIVRSKQPIKTELKDVDDKK